MDDRGILVRRANALEGYNPYTYIYIFFLLKGPVADATDAPQPWRLIVQPYEEDGEDDEVFSAFPL
jgi:hypothetical protein